jgi:protein-tyrosine-phosphatase
MASAFAQHFAGDRLEVLNGGSEPAQKINPDMAKVMEETGIDMAYRIPKTIDAAISHSPPEIIITMGCGEQCPYVPGARRLDWDLPDPAGKSIEFMRDVRDEIERRVKDLICEL